MNISSFSIVAFSHFPQNWHVLVEIFRWTNSKSVSCICLHPLSPPEQYCIFGAIDWLTVQRSRIVCWGDKETLSFPAMIYFRSIFLFDVVVIVVVGGASNLSHLINMNFYVGHTDDDDDNVDTTFDPNSLSVHFTQFTRTAKRKRARRHLHLFVGNGACVW